MTTFDLSIPDELRLTLRGAAENRILTTLRHWPYWLRAEIERDPADMAQCLAVTLIADRSQESTLREILRRSFGMIFPPEGGEAVLTATPIHKKSGRGLAGRRT